MTEARDTVWARLARGWRFYWALGAAARVVPLVALLPAITWLGGIATGARIDFDIGPRLVGFITAPATYSGDPFDHSFQRMVERGFSGNMVYRRLLVHLNNELDYRLLDTSRMYVGNILIGRGGMLYEKFYVTDTYNYGREVPDPELDDMARDLARLNEALARNGIALVVLGSPNKLAVWPDNVPELYQPFDPARVPVYERFAAAARAAGVPFYDGRKSVVEFGSQRGALFPHNGTHWTALGAFAALREPVAALTARNGVPGRLVLTGIDHVPRETGIDTDLAQLLNRFGSDAGFGSDQIRVRLDGTALPKPVVILGSSFTHQLHALLDEAKVAPSVTSIRYLSLFFTCPDCSAKPLPADWPQLVEDASAVVIEINETVSFRDPYADTYLKRTIDRLLYELD